MRSPYRDKSLWLEGLPETLQTRPPLTTDIDVDVVIVGGGFVGLWTAYYLSQLRGDLTIAIVERDIAGAGAAGRNGGWASGGVAGKLGVYGRRADSSTLRRAVELTYEAIDEIERVAGIESIDCNFVRAGAIQFAVNAPQAARLRRNTLAMHRLGVSSDDIRILERDETQQSVNIPNVLLSKYDRRAARVDPARLARGLASSCVSKGVEIFEQTEALEVASGQVRCRSGTVRARHVIRATEAFTGSLPGERRTYLPLYSLMVATEPLPQMVWDELRWPDGLLVADSQHVYFYAQRTADLRIAIGGRGAPYRLGSPIDESYERNPAVTERLRGAIREHFPAAADAEITHQWGGPLAVPRDWCMALDYSRSTGMATVGGLGGHGVTNANILGRTVADLVAGRDTELVRMPWVEHRSRSWEPEPLRYLACQAIVSTLLSADRYEQWSNKPARWTSLLAPVMPPGI